jgi:thiosulfate/3-mercaptopyruvate sulfurtransferase
MPRPAASERSGRPVSEYTTLITATEVLPHLGDMAWAMVDCRTSPTYLAGHIPGAVHAHMERDLSGPIVPGLTGRHPLPEPDTFAEKLSRWGIDDRVQVVVYDDSTGSNAARLWWMLRWLGHPRVAVLEGGWRDWERSAYSVKSGEESRAARQFLARPRNDLVVNVDAVEKIRTDRSWRLLDTRAADRYRGQNETVDPVAGHIPGAVSAPWAENLDGSGRFRSRGDLAARFAAIIGGAPVNRVVCYCGSGVTAAHDILAIVHAGLGEPRLYPGSWSEWITDPKRPVAT